MSEFDLAGKSAIVTGSSRGLGKAIAKEFGSAGASVMLCAPEGEREQLESVSNDISNADHDGTADYAICDVTDRDTIEDLADATMDSFGSIDILVNNAGGGSAGHGDGLLELTPEQWDAVVGLNLGGTVNCCQLIGKRIVEQGDGGAIVNVASKAGMNGYPYGSAYAASKAAILNLTRSFAYEVSTSNVRVNAVAPGGMATERIVEAADGRFPSADEIDEGYVPRRLGTPGEVANIVRLLASPAASYMTGTVVPVSGLPRLERAMAVKDQDDDDDVWLRAAFGTPGEAENVLSVLGPVATDFFGYE